MTAKEYLLEIQRFKKTARSCEEKIESLRSELTGLKSVTYDKDRVQASPTNRTEELMLKLIKAEEKYYKAIARYHKEIAIRMEQIDRIGRNDYAEILRLRYIEVKPDGRLRTLEEIADETHRSFDRTAHLHGEALAAFTKRYLKNSKQ